MATVFPHPAPGDPIMGYQLSEIPSLPPQPIPFLPAPLPVIPPPQGTVYFQPPYILPSSLPQPMFCEQPNVPSSVENTSREGPTNDNAGTVQGMFFFWNYINFVFECMVTSFVRNRIYGLQT